MFLNHKFPNAPISYYFHDTSVVTHLETYAGVDMVVAQIRALFLGVGLKPSSRSILNQLCTYVSIILREEKCCSCSKCSQPGILQFYVSSTDVRDLVGECFTFYFYLLFRLVAKRLLAWKSGSLEVWKSGSLEVWKSG